MISMTGSNDQPVFSWLDSTGSPVPSEMINMAGSVSTLVFSPLAASHAGNYTCVVSLEDVSYNKTMIITVNGMYLRYSIIYIIYVHTYMHVPQCYGYFLIV